MNVRSRALVIGSVGALMLAGSGVAGAWVGGGSGPSETAPKPQVITPLAAGDNAHESAFVPVTPCRVADTRATSKIGANQTRGFKVRGTTGFPAQGGKAGGCNVPLDAVAVATNVTALQASGTGFLRAYASNLAQPTSVFVSYKSGVDATGGGSVGLPGPSTTALKITARNAATHVLIDVTGYYRAPMFAEVNYLDGALLKGSRVTSTSRLGVGAYNVTFSRTITGCVSSATVTFGNGSGIIRSYPASANTVRVETQNDAGAAADKSFYLVVTC